MRSASPARHRGFAALALFCAGALLAAESARDLPTGSAAWPDFEPRYGIPAGTDLGALVERPSLISMDTIQFEEAGTGERRLTGAGEAHGVFPLPLNQLAAVLEDRDGQKTWSDRLLDVRVEERQGNRQLVMENIGIRFLGLSFGYRLRSEFLREELPGGAVGFRSRLVESLDGKLYESFSSWYLEEAMVGDRRMTYFRIYNRPGFRRPPAGMASALKAFTPGELTGTLATIAKEAKRRSK